MEKTTRFVVASALALAGGCGGNGHPIEEPLVGAVDGSQFPVAYRGAGVHVGSPTGDGLITASAAFAHGKAVAYYRFAFPGNDLNVDDLLPSFDGSDPALAYVFDPAPPSPYPAMPACMVTPDQEGEGFHRDRQDPIFTRLPAAPDYLPLVQEVTVTSNGEPCQALKSEAGVIANNKGAVEVNLSAGVTPVRGRPDGRYLAWAIIDPYTHVADVNGNFDSAAARAAYKTGFFDRYLLAYIDGGYATTTAVTDNGTGGGAVVLVTQNLYYPSTLPPAESGGTPREGAPGMGHDVLQYARGEAGYSPICHLVPFTPPDPSNLPTSADAIPASAIGPDTGEYAFCLVQ